MATESLRIQRIKANYFCHVLTILRWIVEPIAIIEEKQRRRVRLLSAFLVFLTIYTLAGAIAIKNTGDSSWLPMVVTAAFLIVGYGFSRTKHYRLAVVFAVSIPAFPSLAAILFNANGANIEAVLMWLALPLLVSTLLLSLRYTVIIAISYVIAIAVIALAVYIPMASTSESLAFVTVITFFAIAIAAIRRQDQSEIEHQLTESRQMEGALRESERKYRTIIENIPQKYS